MKKLIWRLSRLPDALELQALVKDGIMTKEEAREILFKHEDDKEPKSEELKSEIEFLRKLVESLSKGNLNRVTEYIYTYPNPNHPWYQPYYGWCSTAGVTSNAINYMTAGSGLVDSISMQTASAMGTSNPYDLSASGLNFSEIKTF